MKDAQETPVRAPKALELILVFWLQCNVVLLIHIHSHRGNGYR